MIVKNIFSQDLQIAKSLINRDEMVTRKYFYRNHPKAPVLLNKKLASSSLASFFIIEGKHLLHLLLTSVVSQIV